MVMAANVGLSALHIRHIIQQQWMVDIMRHVVRQCTAHVGLNAELRKRRRDRGDNRSCVYTCKGLVTPPGENPTVVVT